MDILILSLVVLAISLIIAGSLMARSKALLGITLGFLPIPLMVFLGRWSIQRSIERCIQEACASTTSSPECDYAQFGCTEWPSLGLALLDISGVALIALYIIGVIIIAVVQSRNNQGRIA
jgi:hypothetical protein